MLDCLEERSEKSNYSDDILQQTSKFNQLLREIRKSKGISQVQVAKSIGMSKQMISKMESPDGGTTLTTLMKYCNCVGIDLVSLLEQEKEKLNEK